MLLATAGCNKDILDENPQSILTPGFLSTSQGVELGVTGVYSGLRQLHGNDAATFTTEAGTDLWTNGISSSSGLNDYNLNDLTPVNAGGTSFVWTTCYQMINTANGVLENAPTAQGLDPNRVKQLMAETKLLRAHYYFTLVRHFGDVPLMVSFVDAPTKDIARAPVADVYAQIITDITEAMADIADKPAQPGRVTRATALHELAKVYLARATSTAKQATDYTNAAQYAKELIDNQARYGIGLEADPATVFAEGNENGKDKPEMIEYCTAPSAAGPWTYRGIIQENVPNSFTTHPGITDYKGKSYFFYHNGALPTGGSYRRSICVDYLNYNPDGTIQPIVQTTKGVAPVK